MCFFLEADRSKVERLEKEIRNLTDQLAEQDKRTNDLSDTVAKQGVKFDKLYQTITLAYSGNIIIVFCYKKTIFEKAKYIGIKYSSFDSHIR